MRDNLSLRQMRMFVAVADELHFGRAAARLGVAQPALSQQLQSIEKALGVGLLYRRPRVALTPAGETLLAEARQVLHRVEQAVDRTRRSASGLAGRLVIGFAASAAVTELPTVIRRYRRRYPDVELDLRALTPTEEVEAVLSGDVDVAFVREVDASPDLRYQPVVRERFGVLLPPRHRLSASMRVRIGELASERFVHFPPDVSPSLYRQIAGLCASGGFAPRVVQEAREWLTEISLVQAGVGVAILPGSFRKLKLGGVTFRPVTGSSISALIAICTRRNEVSSVARRFFAHTLESRVRGRPSA